MSKPVLPLLFILFVGGLTLGCEIELDSITGKYPPILWKDDGFAYPEEKAEDFRVITVGELNHFYKLNCQQLVLLSTIELGIRLGI